MDVKISTTFFTAMVACFYIGTVSQVSSQHPNSVEEKNDSTHWTFNYKDIAAWTANYATCGGRHQSPINFETTNGSLSIMNNIYPKLRITGYDIRLTDIRMTNNGHTVVATVAEGMTVSGGPLGDDLYSFVQLHFHWGSTNNVGAEHRLDNKTFPIECHFVHYNVKYKSLDVALEYPDGLLVIGVWGELSDTNNTALQPIATSLDRVLLSPSTTDVHRHDIEPMEDLFPPNHDRYYHYNGSLTTPTCHESVVWIVFNETIQISEYQLNQFRALKQGGEEHSNLEDNFRPVQPRNGRTVEFVINAAEIFNPVTLFILISIIINC